MDSIDTAFGAGWALDPARRNVMPRRYKSSTFLLGPRATAADARAAVLAECREQGHDPIPDTVWVEETMPPVWDDVVLRNGEPTDITPEEFREKQHKLSFRWNHSLHEKTIVATRWWGYVDVR